MSIIAKAKQLAEESKTESQRAREAEAKAERNRAKLLVNTRDAVKDMLLTELHGQDGYDVDFTTIQGNGCLCYIHRKKVAVGFVCIKGKHFTFDGSDECRDIPSWGINIELRVIPSSDRVLASNVGGIIGHNQSMEDGIKTFSDSLAKHLKGYY